MSYFICSLIIFSFLIQMWPLKTSNNFWQYLWLIPLTRRMESPSPPVMEIQFSWTSAFSQSFNRGPVGSSQPSVKATKSLCTEKNNVARSIRASDSTADISGKLTKRTINVKGSKTVEKVCDVLHYNTKHAERKFKGIGNNYLWGTHLAFSASDKLQRSWSLQEASQSSCTSFPGSSSSLALEPGILNTTWGNRTLFFDEQYQRLQKKTWSKLQTPFVYTLSCC